MSLLHRLHVEMAEIWPPATSRIAAWVRAEGECVADEDLAPLCGGATCLEHEGVLRARD